MSKTMNLNKKHLIVGAIASLALVFIVGSVLITNANKSEKSTEIQLIESETTEEKVEKTPFEITNAVEENFIRLRAYVQDSIPLSSGSPNLNFDNLSPESLETLLSYKEKGYLIKGETLFVPTEVTDDVVFYEFQLGSDDGAKETIFVTAEFNVYSEKLNSLSYDTNTDKGN